MIRTQIQLHEKQIRWLRKKAAREGVSMAKMIRESIDFYQTHIERVKQLQDKRENALNAVGKFSSAAME